MAPRKAAKLAEITNQRKISSFFEAKGFYKDKLFNDESTQLLSFQTTNTTESVPQIFNTPVQTIAQPVESNVNSEMSTPDVPPADPKLKQVEETNKKLVKLALEQSRMITKLKSKVTINKAKYALDTALKMESTLSEENKFTLKNVPPERKYDTKYIRAWLNILYSSDPLQLTRRSLKGTKDRFKKKRLASSQLLYAEKKPISPLKLKIIQKYFSKRVGSDFDEERKSMRHFNYCLNQALKQEFNAKNTVSHEAEDPPGINNVEEEYELWELVDDD